MTNSGFATLACILASLLAAACAQPAATGALPREALEAPADVSLEFDYSAAETMIAAMRRTFLSEAEARSLLSNRGIAAMVKRMAFYFPPGHPSGFVATPDTFVRDLLTAVNQRKIERGPFGLNSVRRNVDQTEALIATLRSQEAGLNARIARRFDRYWPAGAPSRVKVYFIAGGSSDGFIIEDDPEPAFFQALDRARGDLAGVEQVITHEVYHVLQKGSGQRSQGYSDFVARLEQQPVLQKLVATLLWEGSANFVADAREIEGDGPYIAVWRNRYLEHETPQARRRNFELLDSVVMDLHEKRMSWDEAFEKGFSDEQLYHAGMSMVGALVQRHGSDYLRDAFTRPPTQFVRDYLQLAEQDPGLPQVAPASREILLAMPATW